MAFGWTGSRGLGMLAVVGIVGMAAGVVAWGGFNTVMEATNRMEFCVSCHEMRDTVYEEYKISVHYRNASGVRAVCADCHVPKDWTHKVIRKAQATGELYHWLLGSIDTKEKFEAKRHDLARHEWQRMRQSDSRECRNCHSFEAMDFHKQTAKAATAMTAAMKAQRTCIDCHKGIAHTLPDIDAGHRRTLADLSASAGTLALKPGDTVYALTSHAFHLDRPAAEAEANGEIAAATPVAVVAVDGAYVQVEIAGWQREGSEDTLYARQGKRIPLARLADDAAIAGVRPLRVVTDAETGQAWTEVRLVAWTGTGGYVAKLETLWAYAGEILDASCTFCHAPYAPDAYTANAWIGNINAMKRLTRLDGAEVGILQAYLQNNAKDTAGALP